MVDVFFFCKQKTAYEMRISDWSSDVCSSDLARNGRTQLVLDVPMAAFADTTPKGLTKLTAVMRRAARETGSGGFRFLVLPAGVALSPGLTSLVEQALRSEEHTSELQSLMRISYAVFCLKKHKQQITHNINSLTRHNK